MKSKTLVFFVLLCEVTLGMRTKTGCGDGFCKCRTTKTENRSTCTSKRRSLNYFPLVPSYITQYTFTNNYMYHLTKMALVNLTKIRLQILSLKDSLISKIDADAFEDLSFLKKLEISQSNIYPWIVAQSFASVSPFLETLALHDNNWDSLPDTMFDYLNRTNVTKISLKSNKFLSFNGSLFRNIPYIKELLLDKNPLYSSAVDLRNLKYLFKLRLSDTRLDKVPIFCDKHGDSFVPRMRSLYLDNTYIRELSSKNFMCLPYLWKLTLNSISIKILRNDTFALLPSLQTLMLNRITRLRKIEERAFKSSSIRRISFSGNRFRFDEKQRYAGNMFTHCENVVDLDLSSNYIEYGSVLKTLLWPLANLTKVTLQGCSISDLRSGTFDKHKELEILYLSGNKISGWDSHMFTRNKNLVKLYIDGNRIAVVNTTSLPTMLLNTLKEINLSNNPFSCVCQQLWFRDWLKSTSLIVRNFPKRYVCQSPPKWNKKLLISFSYTAEDCEERNPWLWVSVTLASFTIICVMLMVFIYFHLPTVRNIIYILQLKRSGYVRVLNKKSFKFDAYVVYCESDEEWVFKNLIPTIEDQNSYMLCVSARDFSLGASYVDEIVLNMSNSRKVIVLLSNEFIKDEWCQYQVELVQERIRRHGKAVVVIVLLSDVDGKHMTTATKELLKNNSFATWVSGFGQQIFWKVFLSALVRPFDNPPTSVL